jgi:hypothetical protein
MGDETKHFEDMLTSIANIKDPVVADGSKLMWGVESHCGKYLTGPQDTKSCAVTQAFSFPKGTLCRMFAFEAKHATCGTIIDMFENNKENIAPAVQLHAPFAEFVL